MLGKREFGDAAVDCVGKGWVWRAAVVCVDEVGFCARLDCVGEVELGARLWIVGAS